jgi:hypothetical protein
MIFVFVAAKVAKQSAPLVADSSLAGRRLRSQPLSREETYKENRFMDY